MVERVAKSRVSNSSDSKKSDSGRNFKKPDSGTQKVGYFVGYTQFVLQAMIISNDFETSQFLRKIIRLSNVITLLSLMISEI